MSDRQFCSKCGKHVAQEDVFCGSCGAALGQTNQERPDEINASNARVKPAATELETGRQQRTGRLAAFGFFVTLGTTIPLYAVGGIPLLLVASAASAILFFLSLFPRFQPHFSASYKDKTTGEEVRLLWWVRSYLFFLALFSFLITYSTEPTPQQQASGPTATSTSEYSIGVGAEGKATPRAQATCEADNPKMGVYTGVDVYCKPTAGRDGWCIKLDRISLGEKVTEYCGSWYSWEDRIHGEEVLPEPYG